VGHRVQAAAEGGATFTNPFANAADLAFASTYTSPTFTLGSGTIIVFVHAHNRIGTVTGVTIAGVSATSIAGANDGNDNGAWTSMAMLLRQGRSWLQISSVLAALP
jgi:hypothetical protein